jgi:hypothetical protein
MSEANKALARRAWELADNPDVLDEVYAPDVVERYAAAWARP